MLEIKKNFNIIFFFCLSIYQFYNAIMKSVNELVANYYADKIEIIKIIVSDYFTPLVLLLVASFHLAHDYKNKKSVFFDIEFLLNIILFIVLIINLIYGKNIQLGWKIALVISILVFLIGLITKRKD